MYKVDKLSKGKRFTRISQFLVFYITVQNLSFDSRIVSSSTRDFVEENIVSKFAIFVVEHSSFIRSWQRLSKISASNRLVTWSMHGSYILLIIFSMASCL